MLNTPRPPEKSGFSPPPPDRDKKPDDTNNVTDGSFYGDAFAQEAARINSQRLRGGKETESTADDIERKAKQQEEELKRKQRKIELELAKSQRKLMLSAKRGDVEAKQKLAQHQRDLLSSATEEDVKAQAQAYEASTEAELSPQQKEASDKASELEQRQIEDLEAVNARANAADYAEDIEMLRKEGVIPDDLNDNELDAVAAGIERANEVKQMVDESLNQPSNDTPETKKPEQEDDFIEQLSKSLTKRLAAVNLLLTGWARSDQDKLELLENAGFSKAEIAARYPELINALNKAVLEEEQKSRTQAEREELEKNIAAIDADIDERAERQKAIDERVDAEIESELGDVSAEQQLTDIAKDGTVDEEQPTTTTTEEGQMASEQQVATVNEEAQAARAERNLATAMVEDAEAKVKVNDLESLTIDQAQELRRKELGQLREALRKIEVTPASNWKARVKQANEEIIMDSLTVAPMLDPSSMFSSDSESFRFTAQETYLSSDATEVATEGYTPSEQNIRNHVLKVYTSYIQDPDQQRKMIERFRDGTESGPLAERMNMEMESMVGMLLERNRRNREAMAVYMQAMLGRELNPYEPVTTDEQEIKQFAEQIEMSFSGLDNQEIVNRQFEAETALKSFLMQREFIDAGTEGHFDKIKHILESPDTTITFTAAGVGLRVNQEEIARLVHAYTGGTTAEEDVNALGFNLKTMLVTSHWADNHELGHQVRKQLRRSEADAKQDYIATMMVRDFKLRGAEGLTDEVIEQNRSELIELSQQHLSGELNADSVQKNDVIQAFFDYLPANRPGKLTEYLRQVTKEPMTEELGAVIVSDIAPRSVSMAEIGINPEELKRPETVVEEETASMLILTTLYNRMAAQAFSSEDGYQQEFLSKKALFGYLLEQRGDMSLNELKGWLFGKAQREGEQGYPEGGVLGMHLLNGLFDGLDLKHLYNTIEGLSDEDNLTVAKIKDTLFTPDQISENSTQDETWNALVGDISQMTPIDRNSFKGDIQFATNLKGGSYSSLVKDWLKSEHNPTRMRERGGVTLKYALRGNRALIHEDTRSPAMFFFSGLPNPLNVLGVTPMKMNEAYGAWAVKLLGRRTAGALGFHDAFGADPLGKGIPGTLGTLITSTEWGSALNDRLKLPKKPPADRARIEAVRMIDTYAQHAYSIIGELAGAGIARDKSPLLLDAMGGVKLKGAQPEVTKESFREPDLHRFNRVFAESGGVPLTADDVKWLNNDSIGGRSMDTLIAQGHDVYLRKGQMSDKLKGLITQMVPKETADGKDFKVKLLSEKAGGEIHTFDRGGLQNEFKRIADIMMQQDLALHDADIKAIADFNKNLADGKVTEKDRPRTGQRYTIEDLIDRVNRIESRIDSINPDVPASMGEVKWPYVMVNIGKDAAGDPIHVEAEVLKEFVAYFYKAKARKVAEIGVYGVQGVGPEDIFRSEDSTEDGQLKDFLSKKLKLGTIPSNAGLPDEAFELNAEAEFDDGTGTMIKQKNVDSLGLTKEDLRQLKSDGYVTFIIPGTNKTVRLETVVKRGNSINYVQFVEFDQYAKIEKQNEQGFVISYDPFDKLNDEELGFLFGKGDFREGKDGLEKAQGQVTNNIDEEIDSKKQALGIYADYMEKLMQVQEFAEVAKKRKKFWAFLASFNRVMRWTVYGGIIAGLAVNPAMLGTFLWTPDMLIGMFLWDWFFARFLNRARDGWGGRNGIAEETVQKLEGMRNTFEQARSAQSLSTDNINMLRNYVANIENMWENTMESFAKITKYSPNSTQALSRDFVQFADTFIQTSMA